MAKKSRGKQAVAVAKAKHHSKTARAPKKKDARSSYVHKSYQIDFGQEFGNDIISLPKKPVWMAAIKTGAGNCFFFA
jgi:hypothetical protein